MTPDEKNFIVKNLHALISNTIVKSGSLLTILQGTELTEEEKQLIEAGVTEYRSCAELYRIMQIKTNGFSALMKALEQTQQTEAYDILKTFLSLDYAGFSANNPLTTTQIDCRVGDVANVLITDGTLVSDWERFYTMLNLSRDRTYDIRMKYGQSHQSFSLWNDILRQWTSEYGPQATVSELCDVLQRMDFNYIKDKLLSKFNKAQRLSF